MSHNQETMTPSYSSYLIKSFNKNWDRPALSEYPGDILSYGDVAAEIVRLHILFEELGLKPGDKIAICGKNSANWAVAFLAITTYGAVAVPLLHEYTSSTITYVLGHSDSKLFFVSERIWKNLDWQKMLGIEAAVSLSDFHIICSAHNEIDKLTEDWQYRSSYAILHPINCDNIESWIYQYDEEELVVISYTSGTTANPKGVMIPSRALASNITFGFEVMPTLKEGDDVLSILPLAHTYSMAFEFLTEFAMGVHIHFLVKPLHKDYILKAFSEIRPKLIIMVPLILEKIVQKAVMPLLEKKVIKILRSFTLSRLIVNRIIRNKMFNAFGGQFYEIIVGGAALNKEVDTFLSEINFPYTVGYGMTECAPIIGYSDWKEFIPGSCGKSAPRMDVLIDDQSITKDGTGEILVQGSNVMLGYYRNPEETARVIDDMGWLHTGDLGYIDKNGNIFIKGRCKTMILGPSGQNIYPEEIEEKLLSYPFVKEALVIERDRKTIALIYPDYTVPEIATYYCNGQLNDYLSKFRKEVNSELPAFEQIAAIEIQEKEFKKTPKKSIIRYLYK